jgi:hypothetical protein
VIGLKVIASDTGLADRSVLAIVCPDDRARVFGVSEDDPGRCYVSMVSVGNHPIVDSGGRLVPDEAGTGVQGKRGSFRPADFFEEASRWVVTVVSTRRLELCQYVRRVGVPAGVDEGDVIVCAVNPIGDLSGDSFEVREILHAAGVVEVKAGADGATRVKSERLNFAGEVRAGQE